MNPELGPSDDLENLLERAVAAGESDEPARTSRHLDFTLVHRVHNDLDESQRTPGSSVGARGHRTHSI